MNRDRQLWLGGVLLALLFGLLVAVRLGWLPGTVMP